jgi:basic amino acid/polyamine antiporter, APA family
MTGISLMVFRARKPESEGFRTPGHPFTTIGFVTACFLVVASTVYKYPSHSAIGLAILATGVPVYFLWRKP